MFGYIIGKILGELLLAMPQFYYCSPKRTGNFNLYKIDNSVYLTIKDDRMGTQILPFENQSIYT